jgi:hypothetical protein
MRCCGVVILIFAPIITLFTSLSARAKDLLPPRLHLLYKLAKANHIYLTCRVSFNQTIQQPPLSIPVPMYYNSSISFTSVTNAHLKI